MESNPYDQFDEAQPQPSGEANPYDQFDEAPGPMPATRAALDQVPDETLPEVTVTAKRHGPTATWGETIGAAIPTIGARIESKLAGFQEFTGKGEYADARKTYWQSMILPGAVREAKDAGIALTDHPDVIDNAKRLGIRPDVFARDWPTYVNMKPEELNDLQNKQVEKMREGQDKAQTGGHRRELAAQVSADVRPEMGGEWTPKSIVFDALTGIPDLLVGAAGTVAGGPAVGVAAMGASIAPEEWSAAKNQGADDKTAATYATLSSLAQAAPEVPVLKIIEGGSTGRSVLRKLVGDAVADSAVGKVAGTAATQGVSQALIQSLQEGIDAGLIDEQTSLKDALARIGHAGLVGTAMGVPLGGFHAATSRTPHVGAGKPVVFDEEHPVEQPTNLSPGAVPEPSAGAGPTGGPGAGAAARLPAAAEAPAGAPGETAAQAAPRGTETRAALEALQDKTISPPQVEHLENLGLARRNDLGQPMILPAGRRALAAFEKEPEPTEKPAETPGKTPIPTGDKLVDRVASDQDLRTELERMKSETGWAQVGGRVMRTGRDVESGETGHDQGPVTGLTKWIPNAEWWRDRPKGLTEDQVHLAVDKALAGEPLGKRERAMVEHMVDATDRREAAGAADFTDALEKARSDTETEPSEAQKKSGNYSKGEVQFAPGLKFTMENPKGSTRSGTGPEGPWSREMGHDYGYLNRSEGADGDHVDAFLTGKPDTGKAFVINQVRPDTGKFDETKVILGAKDKAEAEATYRANYPEGWKGLGSVVETPTEGLRQWLERGDTTKPFAGAPGERRLNVEGRKAVAAMSPEEMRQTLLTHELTGLPNRRAYDEAPKLSHQVAVDVDSLKWVNDTMGHAHGDELLKTVAAALKEQTGHAFHISGDEFVVQAKSEEEAHEVMREVADSLGGARLEASHPDGRSVELAGLGLSYGVGRNLREADRNLSVHKADREARGERAARGEKPPGAVERARGGERLEAQGAVAEPRVETDRVREDQAAYTAEQPVSPQGGDLAVGERARGSRNVQPPGNLQLFTSDEAPAAARAVSNTHTGLVETGRFSSGIKQVRRWQDAAHIFAPLRKSPQEHIMALVVDAKGKPLAVIRHQIGNQSGAGVVPSLLVGAIGKVEGAAGVWFGHNHPSGEASQSNADLLITGRLHELMRGSGIDPLGMIVVTPGGREVSYHHPGVNPGSEDVSEPTAAARAKRGAVPVMERKFTRIPSEAERRPMTSIDDARKAIAESGHKSGVVFLDNRHRMVATLPMHRDEMLRLRTGETSSGTMHVMRAAEDSNASGAITFGQAADRAPLENIGRLLGDSGLRVIDTFLKKGDTWDSQAGGMGHALESGGPFYSRRETAPRRTEPMDQAEVADFAKRVKDQLGLEDFDLRALKTGDIDLELLQVPRGQRNQGTGSRAMNMLTRWADENGRRVTLQVAGKEKRADWGTTSANRLKAFYRQFGFVSNSGRGKDYALSMYTSMYRDPKPPALSQGYGTTRGLERTEVERMVRQAVRDAGMRAAPDFPHVQVHSDFTTLPNDLRNRVIQDHAEETAGAVYDPETGHIHMISDNLGTHREAVETLWHEAVGHHGLRLVMDADRYANVMDGVWNAMPDRVRQTADRNGLDVGQLAQRRLAAEEVIAYAAGRHLAGGTIDKQVRPFWQRALTAVKAFFARVTGKPFTDDAAIADLIGESKRALESGSAAQRMGDLARSQRAPTFYSPVERAVQQSKQGRASAEQWLSTIRKTPGIKPEEFEWLDLEGWLKEHKGPVTKDELADYIRANKLQMHETVAGTGDNDAREMPPAVREAEQRVTFLAEQLRAEGYDVRLPSDEDKDLVILRTGAHARRIRDEPFGELPEEHAKMARDLDQALTDMQRAGEEAEWTVDTGHEGETQYDQFTLPGGADYHEMLLQLPPPTWHYKGRRDIPNQGGVFHSQHWDEPNVVAHVRFKEREGEDGKRVLHLEELQSDWHQKGRNEGYAPADREGTARKALDEAGMKAEFNGTNWVITTKDGQPVPNKLLPQGLSSDVYSGVFAADLGQAAGIALGRRDLMPPGRLGPVPNAPFKTTWPMLIMKRMIRWAAENGFERIAWTTGDQQKERYNLSRAVDEVKWTRAEPGWNEVRRVDMPIAGGDHHITVMVSKTGEVVRAATASGMQYVGHSLDDLVGQDVARRIIDEPEGHLTGADLQVGGRGMTEFYDQILPRDTAKLIKKYGAEVTDSRVEQTQRQQREAADPTGVMQRPMGDRFRGMWAVTYRDGDIQGAWPTREGAEESLRLQLEGAAKHRERYPPFDAHGFDITPQMREQALSQGFPMFWKKPSQQTLGLQRGQGPGWYERVRTAVEYLHSNPVTKDLRKLINPTKLSEESKRTAVVARAALGNLAHQTFETQEALEHFSRQIDRLAPEQQLEMMDAIEHGVPQPNADLQPVADALRKQLDEWRDTVRGLGTGALDNFIENYFPHYWTQPGQAQRMVATIMGRRPLRGPASFLKMRTIPTIKEGMDAGLTPLTINPLVMTLLKVREMQRFVSGVKMMQSFKDAGLAQFLPATKPMPEGWAEIKDNIAKVRQWSEEEQGFIERGRYIMPEDAARLINNHVGRSVLTEFTPTHVLRLGGNLLNAMQLGFSAFHLGFTTLDAAISKNALGLEQLMHGEVGRAALTFTQGFTPVGPITNVVRGFKLMKAYADPSGATPEMARIVSALELAGGRTQMDRYYMAISGVSPFRGVGIRSLASDVRAALKGPEPIKGTAKAVANFPAEYALSAYRELQGMTKTMPLLQVPFEVAGRTVRASTSWIMEHLVPMQKLGVFSDLAQDYLRRNPTATSDQIARAMQSAWDSVDNRLGEMVYDNVFWNRTFKDANHLAVRAVGWNLGTIREIGGAPIDVLRAVDKLAREGKITADDIGHKIPYVIAMTMTTAALGATINYAFTGQGPQELKDYFFPRTGGTTSHGTPQRLSLPSYVKDVYEYSQRPGTTIANKLNPIFSTLSDIWRNEDYFGNPISEPEAGPLTQAGQRAAFAVKEATPFSIQGRAHIEGADAQGLSGAVKRTLPFIGVTPAPGYVTSPDQIERRERYEAESKYARELKYKLTRAIQAKDQDAIDKLKEQYIQSQRRVKELEVQTKLDKAKAAAARRQNSISMRQQGYPATAALLAALPLEPDRQAREYFRTAAA